MSIVIDSKKVGSFLKSMKEADYIYMKHCIQMRDNIETFIRETGISKEDFAERLNIPIKKYNDFVLGNWNYSIRSMSILNAMFIEVQMEKLKKMEKLVFLCLGLVRSSRDPRASLYNIMISMARS